MLNDHTMYEHILEDDIFFGVVGMLECAFRLTFLPVCRLKSSQTIPTFRVIKPTTVTFFITPLNSTNLSQCATSPSNERFIILTASNSSKMSFLRVPWTTRHSTFLIHVSYSTKSTSSRTYNRTQIFLETLSGCSLTKTC